MPVPRTRYRPCSRWHSAGGEGPAYEDLGEFAPLATEAVRLGALRLGALETLADAQLALGQPEAACDLLASAASEHPWRESLTERLMLALYRSGRPSEALRAFSRLREALDRDLGVEPGSAVRELEESIVVQRPELDLPRGARRPMTVSLLEALPIVGRRTEITAIERTWEGARPDVPGLVLVSGPAGIGKTTLVERATAPIEADGARVLIGHCDPEPSSDYEPLPQLIRAALKLVESHDLDALFSASSRASSPTKPVDCPSHPGRRPVDRSASGCSPRSRHSSRCSRRRRSCWSPKTCTGRETAPSHCFGTCCTRATARCSSSGPTATTSCPPNGVAAQALTEGRLARPDLTIKLDGLDIAELSALVRAWGPEDLRSRMLSSIDELRDLTAGNPMFVREVLREVAEAPRHRRSTRSRRAASGRSSSDGSPGSRPPLARR